MIARLKTFNTPQNLVSDPASGQDWQHPIYWVDLADTNVRTLTIHCQKYGSGACSGIEGLTVRVPVGAQIASGSDQHIAIIEEQLDGRYREVSIYNAGTSIPTSGTWNVGAGALTYLDDSGIQPTTQPGAIAAGWGLSAGMLRGQDLQNGSVLHALFGVIKCTSGSTYPTVRDANGVYRLARQCTTDNLPMDGPKLGDWLSLRITDAEIDSLRYTSGAVLHPSMKILLKSWRDRGILIGDTGGMEFAKPEGGISYSSMGAVPPMRTLGISEGWPTTSNGGRVLIIAQLPWSTLMDKFVVINRCVLDPNC